MENKKLLYGSCSKTNFSMNTLIGFRQVRVCIANYFTYRILCYLDV